MQSKTILAIAVFAMLNAPAQAQDKSSEKDILTIYKGDHSYKEVSVAGKTTEIYVDDKQVAENEVHHYDSLIQALRTEARGDDDYRSDNTWDRSEDERDREQAQREREQVQRDQEQAHRDREQAERDRERDHEQAQREREQAHRDREQAQRDQEQAVRDREQGQRDREQGERDRQEAQEERAMIREIVQYFVDKKVIPDQAHLNAFVLTETSLLVNGVKQPKELQQALKVKYSNWAHNGIAYDNDCINGGLHITVGLSGDCCQ